MPDFTITAEPAQSLTVNLVGHTYTAQMPKTAAALKFAVFSTDSDNPEKMVAALDGWLKMVFGSQADEIQRRMEDPDDLLDVPHLVQLMEKMTNRATGNPSM